MAVSFQDARESILRTFRNRGTVVYQRRDLDRIFEENRAAWRLPRRARSQTMLSLLIDAGELTGITLSPTDDSYQSKTRYVKGDPSPFAVALSLVNNGYLTHGTALFLHQLTDQIPAIIYVNREQTPKPSNPGSLTQAGLERAFQGRQRRSNLSYRYRDYLLTVLSGKHTGRLEVIALPYGEGEELSVTSVERTLIDIAVRPDYAGGVHQVLAAYRNAVDRLSINRLVAALKTLDYVYPYHQAIGFYLERAGAPTDTLERLREPGFKFDFYLAHGLRDPALDKSWRIYHPKGM